MPFIYSSGFWRRQAQDAKALARQMKTPHARLAMIRTAWKYKLIYYRSAVHEATCVFDRAKVTLLNAGLDLPAAEKEARARDVQSKRAAVDEARRLLERHRDTAISHADVCSIA